MMKLLFWIIGWCIFYVYLINRNSHSKAQSAQNIWGWMQYVTPHGGVSICSDILIPLGRIGPSALSQVVIWAYFSKGINQNFAELDYSTWVHIKKYDRMLCIFFQKTASWFILTMSLNGDSGFSKCISSYIKLLGIKAHAIYSLILTHLNSTFCSPSHFILTTKKTIQLDIKCKLVYFKHCPSLSQRGR